MQENRDGSRVPKAVDALDRIVALGTVEELERALAAGTDVNARVHGGMTLLHYAARGGHVEKMRILVARGADPDLADDSGETPLKEAVCMNMVEVVRYLLSVGADRGWTPRPPARPVDTTMPASYREMPDDVRGIVQEAEWKAEMAERWAKHLEAELRPKSDPVIRDVGSLEVLELLLAAGEDVADAPQELQRRLVGLAEDAPFLATAEEYRAWKFARRGREHPERIDAPFWRDMVRTGLNTYLASKHYDDHDHGYMDEERGPVWCFDRMGASLTALPDGRYVRIAGEHEDSYDADFYIYNDVVVFDGRGDFEIYAYPEEVFPPTDSHTATLDGDDIYVIGCIGYTWQRRPGVTPVYRLSTKTWRFEAVATTGEPPGWIYKHRAVHNAARRTVRVSGGDLLTANHVGGWEYVDNDGTFELDLTTCAWRPLDPPAG